MDQKEERFLKTKSDWFSHQKKTYPNASDDVLRFIQGFLFTLYSDELPVDTGKTVLQQQFTNGYCWHFANILKSTFQRGTINVMFPDANHIVWTDNDGLSYDINGVVNNTLILVPTNFLENSFPEFLNNFRHAISFKHCKITKELITTIIEKYKKEKNK